MPNAPKVILHNDVTEPLAKRLLSRFPQVNLFECNSFSGLKDAVADFRPDAVYSVRFTYDEPFPRDCLFSDGGPKWVTNAGVGVDHFGKWDPTRTTVTNAAGVAAGMIGEYVIGGFLYFTLDFPGMNVDKARQHWDATRRVAPLSGKTLLVIGLGNSGQAIAARAKAFGMRVIGTRANPVPMDGIDEVHAASDLIRVLPEADYVSVSTPLTPATRGLIGQDQIAAMKPGVIFADVSRGGVVDQVALHEALQSGHIRAGVLDVFDPEPLPQDSPLWHLPNVLISPHCSAVHDRWEDDSFDMFLDNLDRFIKGEMLNNIVDPVRGY